MVACHLNRGICVWHMCFSDFVCLLHRVGYPYIHELITERHVYTSVRGRESKSWTKNGRGRVADAMIDREEFVSKLGGTHVVCCLAEDLRYKRLGHAFWPYCFSDRIKGKNKKICRSAVVA